MLEYIRQIGMNGYCAIVDIGRYGRMQNYLETYLALHDLYVNLSGYYLGIMPIMPLRGSINGFLYSPEHLYARKSITAFGGEYEMQYKSHEGSTYGYKHKGSRIVSVLGDYEYRNMPEILSRKSAFQTVAMDFVRGAINSDVKADKGMVKPLVRFGKSPTLKGVRLFSFFCNDDGSKAYFVSQKLLWKYRQGEFIHALSNSQWKTGFLKSEFKLPFPYYPIYKLMRK